MLIIFLWWSEGSHLLLDLIQAKNIWLMERDVIASKWKALQQQAIHIRSQKTWNSLLRQCYMPNDMHINSYSCMFFRFAALHVVLRSFFHSSSLSLSVFRASDTLLYCLLHGDCYFPPEHFCFSSSLFTLITSVSLCICIIQNNPIPRVMSRFVHLDSYSI